MPIQRIETGKRTSRAVIANGIVWLSGIVATDASTDIKGQTQQVLARLEQNLAKAGSAKSHILSTQIWLRDIDRDFAGMNEVWDMWVGTGEAPARATGESKLAETKLLIELVVVALVREQ